MFFSDRVRSSSAALGRCIEITEEPYQAEHNAGVGANYTAKRIPVKLAYSEGFVRIDEAFNREKQVQSWSQAKKKSLIEGNFGELPVKAKKDCKKK